MMRIVDVMRRLVRNSDNAVDALSQLSRRIDEIHQGVANQSNLMSGKFHEVREGIDNQSNLINRKFSEQRLDDDKHDNETRHQIKDVHTSIDNLGDRIVKRVGDTHLAIDNQSDFINLKFIEVRDGLDNQSDLINRKIDEKIDELREFVGRSFENSALSRNSTTEMRHEWKVDLRELRPVVPLSNFSAKTAITKEFLATFVQTKLYKDIERYFAEYPKTSLMAEASRAILYSLVRLTKPELVAEIGTFYAGTAEVIARALWENGGSGELYTCDPFDVERHPFIFRQWPEPLQRIVKFFPANSMKFLSDLVGSKMKFDIILIDGDHDYESAAFDLAMSARLVRPGGIIVMDNAEQTGPFEAARQFLVHNPEWRELGDCITNLKLSEPFANARQSVPGTSFLILQAGSTFTLDSKFRSWGQETVPPALNCPGFSINLLPQNCRGQLHFQAVYRGFVDQGQEQEELKRAGDIAIELTGAGKALEYQLSPPLESEFHRRYASECRHTFELELVWEPDPGSPGLKIAGPPRPIV
jgi:predicted O-methyltransferase YrrM